MYWLIITTCVVNSELKQRIHSRSYVIIFLTLSFYHTHKICMLHTSGSALISCQSKPLQSGQNSTLRDQLTFLKLLVFQYGYPLVHGFMNTSNLHSNFKNYELRAWAFCDFPKFPAIIILIQINWLILVYDIQKF